MAYVMPRVLKRGVRYTAIYTDENGRYKSAGAYDSRERAQYGSRISLADQGDLGVAGESGAFVEPS